MTCTAV